MEIRKGFMFYVTIAKYELTMVTQNIRLGSYELIDLQHLLPATPPFEALSTSVITRVSKIMK